MQIGVLGGWQQWELQAYDTLMRSRSEEEQDLRLLMMVSQIISAVKDKRPLLSVLPIWGEILWIWSWSAIGSAITRNLT
jgi:CHASE2 domain-containing sensor protein